MAFLPYTSLPPVLASPGARELMELANTQHVPGYVFGDSRNSLAGFGDMYMQRLNYREAMMYGPPKWSKMQPFGVLEPAAGTNDPYGSLEMRRVGAGVPVASDYDVIMPRSKCAPGFVPQAFDFGYENSNTITPEAVMTHPAMNAANAQVVNRGTFCNIEVWATCFAGPVGPIDIDPGVGVTLRTFTGNRQMTMNRGYNASHSQTGVAGAAHTSATAVPGYGDLTTAFDFAGTAVDAPCKWTFAAPFNPDTSGFPFWKFYSLAPAQGPICCLWGWRFQDPSSTTGRSWTSLGLAGATFTTVPTLHANCQPHLQAMASIADFIEVIIGYGVNDAIGSGLTADQIYTNAMTFIAWVRAAWPGKKILFRYEGYSVRLDDGGGNFAGRLAEYSKVYHAVAQAMRDSGEDFIAVNGGLLLDRRGHTQANETIAALTGVWGSGTAYTAGQIVSVTQGGYARFFKCVVGNTGNDPTDPTKLGFWTQVKGLLGGTVYTEGLHPYTLGQLARADVMFDASLGRHWTLNGSGTSAWTTPIIPSKAWARLGGRGG